MKVCKNCGEYNDKNAEFCVNCGYKEFAVEADIICPACKTVNGSRFSHCTNCGATLPNVVTLAPSVQTVSNTAVSEKVIESSSSQSDDKQSIKRAIEKLYENKIDEVADKETIKCPYCNTELQVNSVYCYKCGKPVYKQNEHKVVKRKICPHCGTPNLVDTPYCSYCFASLSEAETEDFQVDFIETVNDGKNIIRQAIMQSVGSPKVKVCNNCGSLNSLDEHFCVKCGLKLDIEIKHKYCFVCGKQNPLDAVFCEKCQYAFQGVTPDQAKGVWKCSCGQINDKESVFCVKCGQKISNNPVKGGNK
ncbi:MAG: zinc ribbon domain-containing protein [Clostridia bacterium]